MENEWKMFFLRTKIDEKFAEKLLQALEAYDFVIFTRCWIMCQVSTP